MHGLTNPSLGGDYSVSFFTSDAAGVAIDTPFINAAFHVNNPVLFSGGDGSALNPWLIASCEQLQNIDNSVDYADDYFVLTGNIDCTSISFSPLDFGAVPFSGSLSGLPERFAISNLSISVNSDAALFLKGDNAKIENITLEGANITSQSGNAALIFAESSGVYINNVTVKSTQIFTLDLINSKSAGGLVALLNLENGSLASVDNVSFSGTITGTSSESLGGLSGKLNVNNTVLNISNTKFNVTINGVYNVGGVIGKVTGTGNIDITETYLSGDILALSGEVGGYFGNLTQASVTFNDSYSSMTVLGEINVGGFVGSTSNSQLIFNKTYVSGLFGNSIPTEGKFLGGYIGNLGNSAITLNNSFSVVEFLNSSGMLQNYGYFVGEGSESNFVLPPENLSYFDRVDGTQAFGFSNSFAVEALTDYDDFLGRGNSVATQTWNFGEVWGIEITGTPVLSRFSMPDTVYVNSSWTGNLPGNYVFGYNAFSDIQLAINKVKEAGTVYLLNSNISGENDFIVTQPVQIYRPVNIIGESLGGGQKVEIFIQDCYYVPVFMVESSNVTIENIAFLAAGTYGTFCGGSGFSSFAPGVISIGMGFYSENALIQNNTFSFLSNAVTVGMFGDGASIVNNYFYNNRSGVWLISDVSFVQIDNNTMENNLVGIGIGDINKTVHTIVDGLEVTNNNIFSTSTETYGIYYSSAGDYTFNAQIGPNNVFSYLGVAINIDGGADDLHINGNAIYSNLVGFRGNEILSGIDVTQNWWGDASGPIAYDNPAGTGDILTYDSSSVNVIY